MTLRRATASDLDAIDRMLERCTVRTRLLRFNIPVRELPRTYAARIARPTGDDAHWVAAADDEVVALVSVGDDEIGVLVEDAWQRRGLGTRLLSRAVAEAARRGATELAADVAFANPHALRMLRRLGRSTLSVTPEGYRLVMQLAATLTPCSTAPTKRRTARSPALSRS
ncbi:MAG TPA: GNAT family N-acetyltransferase [Gaiellaceae bacterium]|jgi:GNAT superfamily N-acetyltransferase|nr:GNAT family N-acetyltransferase [Gaiellaceae bacterium]